MSTKRKKKPTERGAELARLRRQCGMTKAEWARALGVSWVSVYRYETGGHDVAEPVMILARHIAAEHGQGKGAKE